MNLEERTGGEQLADGWKTSRFSYEAWVRARLGWRALKAEEYVDEGFSFLSTPDIKGRHIEFNRVNFISQERYEESPEIQLRVGDVLLAKDGSTLGTVNIVRELPRPSTVNSSIAVITPGPRLDSVFLYYSLQGSRLKSSIAEFRAGMGVPHLFQDDIRRFSILMPPIGEQRQIADYLDAHTAKIETLIGKQERLIETLAERRQAVISHAVTRGLDPNVPMKNSGVGWLGKVPSHWTTTAMKRVLAMPITDGPHETPDFVDEGVPFVSAEAVSSGEIRFDKIRGHISPQAHARFSKKYVPARDDIYVVKSGATTGVAAIVDTDDVFNIWSPLAAIRVGSGVVPRFLLNFIRSREFQSAIELHWSYGTQQNIGMGTLGQLPVALPPKGEQIEIVVFLSAETAKIDALAAKAREMIDMLKERRQALISAAVTGKIDVRGLS